MNEFLEDYKASVEFVNANVDEAAARWWRGYEHRAQGAQWRKRRCRSAISLSSAARI